MNNLKKGLKSPNLFRRFLKDERGNTIIFVGAALIPLMAVIGGGIDASRGYMAKARLQQACDAATLAGRRAVGNGTFTVIAEQQADRLFDANFERGFLGSDPDKTTFQTSSTNGGNTVAGTATASIPTVIMRIFGNETMDLTVQCEASLDIANADITMVLDTTGSMNQPSGGPNGETRIEALRAAAKSFYGVLDTASQNSGARIRYGFVPYSSNVNVGRLLVNNSAGSLVIGQNSGESYSYPTRRAIFEIPGPVNNTTERLVVNGFNGFVSELDCENYGANVNTRSVNGFNNSIEAYRNIGGGAGEFIGDNPITNTGNPITDSNGNEVTYSFGRRFGQEIFPPNNNTGRQRCERNVSTQTMIETTDHTLPNAEFKRWEYRNLEVFVDDYVRSITTGNPVTPASNFPPGFFEPAGFDPDQRHRGNLPASTWEGCIEERDTVSAAAGDISFNSSNGISPARAFDLDIDSAPTDDATKWRPYWPEINFIRVDDNFNSLSPDAVTNFGTQRVFVNAFDRLVPLRNQDDRTSSIVACPTEARLLSEQTRSEFDAYLDRLIPRGATYHDIGAIWGARMTSPDGIFADNVNETAPNNGFVSRNMIFLTDGLLEPRNFIYSAYGIEIQNSRVGELGVSDEELTIRHNARFLAICEAIKAKGIRVFVVAFGTELSTSLQRCASVNSAFSAEDSGALNNTFLQIASNIADLRLTN